MLSVCLFACGAAAGQTRGGDAATAQNTEASPLAQDKTRSHVSKFEARRARRACRDQAQKSGVVANGKSAFLSNCFRLHIAARHDWSECKRLAASKSLDKAAAEEFVRACVSERQRRRAGPEHRE